MKISARGLSVVTVTLTIFAVSGVARVAVCQSAAVASASAGAEQPDHNTWLEDISGEKQLAWVRAENTKATEWVEKSPHFATLQAEALKVLDSPDRIPMPEFRRGAIYNTWNDASHVRGIVRRTTLQDYLSADPKWETVLDYDALGAAEKQSWVGAGMNCLMPEEELCMVALSAGGEDANTMREFNLKSGTFVENGFQLPRGKQSFAWLDKDTLLVSRDWGPGTISSAGYPLTVRTWKRGTPLEAAKEVFRGAATDMSVGEGVLRDAGGHRATVIGDAHTFYSLTWYLLLPDGPKKLGLPSKSQIEGLVDNRLIVTLQEDWMPAGQTAHYVQGSVLSLDLDAVQADAEHLKPTVLFAPTDREFEQEVGVTRHHVLLTTLNNVQGRAYIYSLGKDGKWTRRQLPVPDNQAVDITWTGSTEDRFFLSLSGFLTPPSLWLGNATDGSLTQAKSEKPRFDASKLTVEQFEATSKDGTRVPYFVVRPKEMKFDGTNPTLLTAYGGFQVSITPDYDPVAGKLWLERGGVYVVANIRGGGEFGPAWHEAGLKTHRQRIYDDFYAVAQDLLSRKITSPAKLGIDGASNGGLLMGVEMTQHPEMWKAVLIERPLLDMLSYEHLAAGASWVGEYGSVSVPDERAFLASISPYNQIRKDVNYPEPMIMTNAKDDRVGPVHARKFAARMEEFGKPFLYYEIVEGGHGTGADNKEVARTNAVRFTYLITKLMD